MTNTKQLEPTAEKVRNALKKQEYVPLLEKPHGVGRYRCPTCGVYFFEDVLLTNCCGNCGQRIAPLESNEDTQ